MEIYIWIFPNLKPRVEEFDYQGRDGNREKLNSLYAG